MGSAYSVDFKPELARSWSAVRHKVSLRVFSCLLVMGFLFVLFYIEKVIFSITNRFRSAV